jgi:hypothetical protein
MASRSFVWLSTGGGAWSLGSNWDDVTDGTDPALVAPGAQDSVTVTGPSGAQVQTIIGGGAAAYGLFAGNTLLSGAYAIGTVTLGGAGGGGILQLGAGAALSAGTASIASGSLLAGHGSTLSVSGTVALGTTGLAGATLNATGGAVASVLGLLLADSADSITVDPASILEVGGLGRGAAGTLTVDAGNLLSGQGSADAYGAVADNGTIAAAGGTLSLGALSGTGTLRIGAEATLALNGACGAGLGLVFAGANATLALNEEVFAPAGTLTGLAPGDAIDVRGSPISSASFAGNASGGVLTLFYGGQVAATLNLAGSYAGYVFLTAGDGAGGTLVTLAAASGGGGGPSPGTPSPDQYLWTAPGSGAWNQAANWQDLTSGANPATIAPGAANLVTVAASPSAFSVLAGPANAASLTLLGEVGLSGAYHIGTLAVGAAAGTPATLDLLAGATLAAASATLADGAISVSGSAAALSVAGTLALGGGPAGVGLPTASLSATAGAGVRVAGLTMGGGAGAWVTTDPTAWVEVGSAGAAAAGAVTVDAGATLSGNGQLDPYGAIVDNGAILATGGTLSVGAVSGTGSLAIAGGATLELIAPTADPIVLGGTASDGATLALGSARTAPTGTLTGLAVGDAIDVEGSQITSAQYAPGANGGTLLLSYGATVVARIPLTGAVPGARFVLLPDAEDGTLVAVLAISGGGGGGGQTGTDQLAWTQPVGGNWSRAANWTDTTTGTIASQPPGAQTPALVAGPTGGAFQSIAGTGTCASLTLTGDTLLAGSYAVGQLNVGEAAAQGGLATAATLEIGPAGALAAAQATVADGQLICAGAANLLAVSGTLSLGGGPSGAGLPDTLLSAAAHGTILLGGLTLGGGDSDIVTMDSTAVLEVGTAGGAAAGVLTVDSGAVASGNGALDIGGPVLDNGTIAAQGGVLAVGAVSGAGTLSIGTEATLVLDGTDSCPIAMAGAGATLVLPGLAQLPSAAVSGFAPGDSIVSLSPVDGVAFQPGGGGIGTLSLSVAGQAAGRLLLAGSFAGESFSVQPDGTGAAIIVSSQGPAGPPPGTVTPDSYSWTGAAGDGAWSDAANWADTTQGSGPAAVAPGQHDLVTIAGGGPAALAVAGPADAAGLSLSGTVALSGAYGVGTLSVGAGLLALGAGASLSAASAQVAGGLAVGGGALSVAGTLALGPSGLLAVSGGSTVRLRAAVLAGAGSALATDATGAIEIGGATEAVAGGVTIDAGGVLSGAGSVEPVGQITDQGTISASGGTLVLGSVAGTGTLLVASGADLVLSGAAAPALLADFTGAGTLTLAGPFASGGGAPAIADFGTGASILLPVAGAVSAAYALTGPGIGLLTLTDGSGDALAQLTLLGDQTGRAFAVAAAPGGGTILTTQPDTTSNDVGGNTLSDTIFTTGQIARGDLLAALAAAFPYVSQIDAGNLIGNEGIFVDDFTGAIDPATGQPDPLPTIFGAGYGGPGVNLEVVAPLSAQAVQALGGAIAMQPGYSAVLLQGSEPMDLTDAPTNPLTGKAVGLGGALLVGNQANGDVLAALGDGDTLVGAPGYNTTFYASLTNDTVSSNLPVDVYVHGGGNDAIATNYDNAAITTSGGASSIFLGPATNTVVSNGSDTIICSGPASDTVTSMAQAGRPGDVVFVPTQGLVTFTGGDAPSTVVGAGGQIYMQGGDGGGSLLWVGDSNAEYQGGAGAALIVAGSGYTSVQGGSGPVTVFGGTGQGVFSGGPGSVFVVGAGDCTVSAIAGNAVYVQGPGNVSVAGGPGVDAYAGGSTGHDIFQAFSGNETLWGGAGQDLFMAGSGNDVLVSGGGTDTFSFTNGIVPASGIDSVVGFVPGQGTIALHGFGTQTPTLAVAYGDTVITLQNGAQIIVENVTNLTRASFTFT